TCPAPFSRRTVWSYDRLLRIPVTQQVVRFRSAGSLDDAKTAASGGSTDHELIMRQDHDLGVNRFGKIDGEGTDQGRFEFPRVLPYAWAKIVSANETARLYLGIYPQEVDGDAAQCMVAVDIGKVQAAIRNAGDHLGGGAATDPGSRPEWRDVGPRLGKDVLEFLVAHVPGLVPLREIAPRVDQVICLDCVAVGQHLAGERSLPDADLGHGPASRLVEKVRPHRHAIFQHPWRREDMPQDFPQRIAGIPRDRRGRLLAPT